MSLFYWKGVQDVIDSFREEVRDRINFELTCIKTACPCSFDDFDIPLDCEGGFPCKEIKEVIGTEARQLTIMDTEDDVDVVVYIAGFYYNVYVLHVFTTDIGKVRVSDIEITRDRYKEIELSIVD